MTKPLGTAPRHRIRDVTYPAGAGRMTGALPSSMACSCGWEGEAATPELLGAAWSAHRLAAKAGRVSLAGAPQQPGWSYGAQTVNGRRRSSPTPPRAIA